MVGLIVMVSVLLIWWIVKLVGAATGTAYGSGVQARGILLWVAAQPSGSKGYSPATKLQLRMARVDVEIPGQIPFEVTTKIAIPLNLVADVVPGATVELLVSERDVNHITVIGPGICVAQSQLPVTTQGGTQ